MAINPLMVSIFGFALLFVPGNSGKPELGFQIFGALIVLTSVGLATGILCAYYWERVVADGEGVRWRGAWGKWRSVGWSEVSDYYQEHSSVDRAQGSQRILIPVLVTPQGLVKVRQFDAPEKDAFCRIVQARATAARVCSWGVIGVRRVDTFPQTFGYWNPLLPWKVGLHLALLALFYIITITGSIRLFQYVRTFLGWQQGLLTIGLLLVGIATLSFLPTLRFYDWYQQWRRRDEKFIVTPEGFRYEGTPSQAAQTVPWKDVSDYYYAPKKGTTPAHYVLVLSGSDEQQFRWDALLQNSQHLLDIVREYAPRPALAKNTDEQWRTRGLHEKTGGSDPTTWQGGAVGMGARVFHYRDAGSLCTVIAGAVNAAMLSLLFFLSLSDTPEHTRNGFVSWFFLAVALLCLFGAAWGLLHYLRVRVDADDMGITQHDIFGKKHLYRYAVSDYTNKGDTLVLHGKNGVRIAIRSGVIGYEELKAEIERLAPPPQTGWKQKGEQSRAADA